MINLCSNACEDKKKQISISHTVAFNHERFDYIMANHFKIGMANPVADSGF